MSDTTDPARETVPAETWTNEDLAPLTRDEFRAMLKDGHFNVPRLRTKDAMLAVLIGTHFAHRRAWNECDKIRADLAARTTARDQALAERDALRKELDALRAEVEAMRPTYKNTNKIRASANALSRACGVTLARSDFASSEEYDEAVIRQVVSEFERLRSDNDALRAAQTAPPQPLTTTETQPAPHTPGPWIVEDTGTHLWIGPPRSDGSGKVADIVVSMDIAQFTPEARARAIANACLIAAAPDLRASRPASLGEKVRDVVRLWKQYLSEDGDSGVPWDQWCKTQGKLHAALDALTDADLAAPALPDHVRECVEACEEYAQHFDDSQSHSAWMRCVLAGRAARAKGGA